MAKRTAGSATTAKLTQLALDLADAEKAKKNAEADIARIKGEIADITAQYALPIKESKSEYLAIDGGPTIRITRAAAPVPKVLTQKLFDLIKAREPDPYVANQIFLEVYVLPKYADINVDAWQQLVEEEVLLDSMLRQSLEEAREAPKPSVALTHRKDF